MDRSVSALINFGAIDCWTKPGTRVTGIALGAGLFDFGQLVEAA